MPAGAGSARGSAEARVRPRGNPGGDGHRSRSRRSQTRRYSRLRAGQRGEKERPTPHLSKRPRSRDREIAAHRPWTGCAGGSATRSWAGAAGLAVSSHSRSSDLDASSSGGPESAGGHDNLQQRPGSESSRDWPASYGPNSPRSRQALSARRRLRRLSCGSRRCCARISLVPGDRRAVAVSSDPAETQNVHRVPEAWSLVSQRGSRRQARAWSACPVGSCSGLRGSELPRVRVSCRSHDALPGGLAFGGCEGEAPSVAAGHGGPAGSPTCDLRWPAT